MKKLIIPPNSGTQLAGKWICGNDLGVPKEQILYAGQHHVFTREVDGDEHMTPIDDHWYEVAPPAEAVKWTRTSMRDVLVRSGAQQFPPPWLEDLYIEIDGKAVPLVFLVKKEGV